MKYFFTFTLLFLIILHSLKAQENVVYITEGESIANIVTAKNGMVLTNSVIASQTALNILKKGGNAVDAAIAANAVLGVTNPTSGGVGGDLYALIWDARTKQIYGLNSTGRTPGSLSYEKFKSLKINNIESNSPLSITVPGCVDGWNEMHEKFGRLPANEILMDAIRFAENGFILTKEVSETLENEIVRLQKNNHFKKIYMVDSIIPSAGNRMYNPDLANLYKMLANKGFRSFYKSEISQKIANSVLEAGGYLNAADLVMHHSEWVDPISIDYRGNSIYQLPPNSMGISMLNFLKIIENFDLNQLQFGSKKYLHTLIEVNKLATQDHDLFLKDPTYVKYKPDAYLSLENSKKKLGLFSSTEILNIPSHTIELESNTISIIISDGEGNLVVLAQNNYEGMGSGVVADGLGFVLQNRASSYSLKRNDPNVYAAFHRPYFNSLPCIVFQDGKPLLGISLTNNGSNSLIEAQILINLIDFKMEPLLAFQVPFVFNSQTNARNEAGKNSPWISIEKGINYQVVRELISIGHRIKFVSKPKLGMQALFLKTENSKLLGISRSSEKGIVVGY
jgi:gamma-glutamyltranspeptidase/glutathione hydrolase